MYLLKVISIKLNLEIKKFCCWHLEKAIDGNIYGSCRKQNETLERGGGTPRSFGIP
jgi:hypothetical protein